jgi:hypothetical protein
VEDYPRRQPDRRRRRRARPEVTGAFTCRLALITDRSR